MAKNKAQYSIKSYGIYDGWDAKSKALPRISDFTTDIPARIEIEFGFILHVLKGKGKRLTWMIHHPNIPNDKGEVMPPFEGDIYVGNNDWQFYLGDTIWAPIENKVGNWHMSIEADGKIMAEKTFSVEVEHGDGEIQFWKKRGY